MDNQNNEEVVTNNSINQNNYGHNTGSTFDNIRRNHGVTRNQRSNIVSKPMGRYGGNNKTKENNSSVPQQSKTQMKKDNANRSNDVGTNNLKKSKSRRGLNNLFSRKGNTATTTPNETDDNNDTNEENSAADEVGNVVKKAKKIKLIMVVSGILLAILPVIFIIVVVVSVISSIGSIFTLHNDPTAKEDWSQWEPEYYAKLDELSADFKKRCPDEELNVNLLHAIAVYYWYQNGFEDEVYSSMTLILPYIYVQLPKTCNVDYSTDGEFFNNLLTAQAIYDYYGLQIFERDKLSEYLTEAFKISESLNVEADNTTQNFVAEEATISTSSSNVSFKDYLSGTVYANINNNDLSNNERIKALTIASTSNILAKNNMSLSTGTISLTNSSDISYCSVSEGCSYTTNKTLVSGSGTGGNGNNVFDEGGYYYKVPLNNSIVKTLNNNVNDIYGNVLVDSNGNYISVDLSKISTASGSTYQEILANAYGDVTIKNIRENTYIDGVNFGNKKVLTDVIFYDQKDYSNVSFCGLKKSIGDYGCGTTAMAILLSTYENDKKYDPVYTMNKAYSWGYCGKGGTSDDYFKKQAREMGYHYLHVGKKNINDKNLVLSHLSQGHLIIINVGSGIFTGSGHYMVLSGIDPDIGKVYVNDPNNRSNSNNKSRKSGNGWYSFNNIIVPQTNNGYYIIWKD